MLVDATLLHAGGDDAHCAGEEARAGAHALSGGPMSRGMFGEFAAATAFHDALRSALLRHATHLQGTHRALVSISDRSHQSAVAFTEMDERGATEMRTVPRGRSPLDYPQPP